MLAGRAFEMGTMQHGHNDGTWHDMDQVSAEPAHQDPERGWIRGVIFRCRTCEDEIRVIQPADAEPTTAPLTEP